MSPRASALDPGGAEAPLTRLLGDLRAACRGRLTERLGARTAPLASALILGQREGIDPDDNDAFARTGTTHLLAISGLQLQALAAALALLFRLCGCPEGSPTAGSPWSRSATPCSSAWPPRSSARPS